MTRTDPHSHFDDHQPRTTRWHLRLLVDFESRILAGEVTLLFAGPVAGVLDLDSKGLAIHRIWVSLTGAEVPFERGRRSPSWGGACACTCPRPPTG
jgi:hypothetical protein